MLLDHFHPPLCDQRDWHGFHHAWATYISASLNRQLPPGWFAQPHVDFGIEIDVATLEESTSLVGAVRATEFAAPTWSPSTPQLTLDLPLIADLVEINIYDTAEGRTLVGAIEIVSPSNKDRPESRKAFAAKCESLVAAGIGLVIVDLVTHRRANLHRLLLEHLGHPEGDDDGHLYAAAYHPVQRAEHATVDIWVETLEVGKRLPTIPLFLRGGPCLPVQLEETYERTCTEQRIPRTGA